MSTNMNELLSSTPPWLPATGKCPWNAVTLWGLIGGSLGSFSRAPSKNGSEHALLLSLATCPAGAAAAEAARESHPAACLIGCSRPPVHLPMLLLSLFHKPTGAPTRSIAASRASRAAWEFFFHFHTMSFVKRAKSPFAQLRGK